MARFTSYPNKAKPADSDTLLINDAGSSSNKQVSFTAVLGWVKDKLGSSTIDGLDTTSKNVVGAINELHNEVGGKADSSSVYTKSQVDALIESVDVETDTTLSVSGKPADAKVTGDEISALKADLQTLTLGIDDDDGLLYLYINGVKHGEGVEVGGGSTTRYTITYNLAPNMISSNIASRVVENNAYTTTISSSSLDYQIDDITVTMGGIDITSTAVDGNIISIPSVTGNVAITVTALYYPSVETETDTLTIGSGGTGTLKVRLHAQPTQSQVVSLYSDELTLSSNSLTFTSSNWDTYQSVTVTAPSVDDTTYAYINMVNSDPLMTESTIMVTVKELGYEDLVDTTIPTADMHTVTADDFSSTSAYGDYIRLYTYNGSYDNIKIPATLNGKIPWLCCGGASNNTFANNTTIKYVSLEDGVIYRQAGTTSGCLAESLFSGCTSLIGVSNMDPSVTSLKNAFNGCTSLKFVDNLDELVNVADTYQAFYNCTSLEYVQDLSNLTNTGLARTFRGCSALKKIFGCPDPSTSKTFEYCFMGTQVEKVTFPQNVSSLVYAFSGNSHVNNVTILADGLSTSNINQIFGSPSQNIDVYANPNSTTLASLQSTFASSTKVSVHEIGSTATLPSIVVWGDSTSSPNKTWIEWPKRLQNKLGTSEYLVKNQAVSGEYTTSTSARQGGNTLKTSAFTIPADTTATLVTLSTEDGQTFSNDPVFSAGGAFNPCSIGGVSGLISKSGASYYFTRSANGSAVPVSANSVVTSDQDGLFNNSDNIMLIQIGHNKGWDSTPSKLVNQMQLMVDYFESQGGTKYIITGPWSGTWITTDSGWAITEQVNTLASEAFGSHYFNLPVEIAQNCQTDNPTWTPTADDLAYIQAGKTPMSLTSDNVHPNEFGANSMMMAYYRKGVVLGYWT